MSDWRDYAVPDTGFDKSDWRSYAVLETSVQDKSDWRSYATYEAAPEPEAPQPSGSFLGNIARSAATGAGAALGGLTSAAGYIARKFDNAVPMELEHVFDKAGVRPAGDMRGLGARLSDALLEEGAKAQDMARGWSANVPRNLVNQTAEGIGSMVPYLAAGGAAGLAARGSAAIAGLARAELETQANAAQTYQDMRRAGYDDETAMRAARRQEWPDRAVNAALEPFGALSGRSRPVRALAEAVSEGLLQEPAQNITSAAAQRSAEGGLFDYAGALVDEARKYPEHFKEVGLPAMIAGGIVGAVSPGVRQRQGQQTQTEQQAQPAQPQTANVEMLSDVPHTPEQQRVIAEYESSTDPKLLDFVNRARNREGRSGERFNISAVTPKAIDEIKTLIGVDVSGSIHSIDYDALVHNDKRHGARGVADHTMENPEDVARIGYVLNNYDSIALSDKKSTKFTNRDGTPANIIEYRKQIDGSMCVVEVVPDTKRRTLHVIGAWKNKSRNEAGLSAPSDAEMLSPDRLTSETRDQSSPADSSLPNAPSDVNNLSSASQAWIEPEMPQGTGESSPKVRDIRNIIERVTGMPVREGQVRKRNVLGYIDHLHEVIRSKSPNDIATMLHEFGHAMDRRFKISERNGRAYQELNDFGRQMGYPEDLWHSEGLAQFFQWRGIDPEQAYARFPEYSKAFDAFLAENANARKAIDEVFRASQEYYHASPEARLDAVLSDGKQERRSLREWGRDTWREARRQLFDRQAPLAEVNKAVAEKLGVTREMIPDRYNLEAAARTMPGTQAVIDAKVDAFVKNFDGFTPEEYESLRRYMAAGGGLDYFNNGMNPGMGMSEVELTGIRERTPEKIKRAAENMRREYDQMMDETLVDAGLISKKMIKKWREKYPNYVPMLADNADGSVTLLTPQQARSRGYVSLDNPVQKRSGVKNERDVVMRQDPIHVMLENFKKYGDVAARNRVGQVLINISKLPGMARVAEKVPPSGKNTFYVWQNGKKHYYATDPELYAAFRSLDEMGIPQNRILKFARSVSEGFKAGTTRYNPWFILRNLIRDSFTVGLQSRASVKDWRGAPIVNTIEGIMQMVGADEKLLREAREDGLFYSSLVEMNRQNIPRLVEKHLKGGRLKETVKQLEAVADRVGEWNEIVEVAPKLREYKRLREMGVPRKQAAMMGREVNTDFQRSGVLVRSLNQYVPFLNAQMQGLDKVVRTFKEHPVESVMKTGLYIALPSIIEWAMYHDDEAYKALDKEIKDTHWVFRLPGAAPDDWVRVPMPFEVGVLFGGGTKRALDAILEKDPAAGYKFLNSLSEAFLIKPMDAMPAVLKAPIEIWANMSSFMDRPIVPRREQGLPDRLQYGSSTSYLAKQAGRLGFSPRNVDHVIRSFGGSMGAQAAHVFDVLDRGRAPMPARNWHESTLFRPYTISSDTSNHYIDRFYTVTDELSKGESGAKLEKVRYENAALADFMQGRQRALGKIWREIAAVREARGMSPEAKAERIDRLNKRAGEIAKRSLEIYDKHVK